MPCIVHYATKKAFKLAVEQNPGSVSVYDPSIMGERHFTAEAIPDGREEVVTNHPRRSWFAQVGRKGGKLYVK